MDGLQERMTRALVSAGVGGVGLMAADGLRGIMDAAGLARLEGAVPGWRGVVCVTLPYFVDVSPPEGVVPMARYAWGRDYHVVLTELLECGCAALREAGFGAAAYVDASPIPEVRAAAMCGLGVIGRNGLLLTKEWGSWVFIGCIVTDAPLEFAPAREFADGRADDVPSGFAGGQTAVGCADCGACVRVCPVGALREGRVDARRCLSALSQRSGELTAAEEALLRENRVSWGCDRCQEACPMNRGTRETTVAALREQLQFSLPEDAMQARTRREFAGKWPDRAFTWKGPRVVQRNLGLFAQEQDSKFV